MTLKIKDDQLMGTPEDTPFSEMKPLPLYEGAEPERFHERKIQKELHFRKKQRNLKWLSSSLSDSSIS